MNLYLFRKTFFLILIVMLAATSLVTILAWGALNPINEKAGFNRKNIVARIQQLVAINKPADVLDFAGETNLHIYFKTKNPAKLYVTDKYLQNGKYLSLNVPSSKALASVFNCIVDSPDVYVLGNNIRSIIATKFDDTTYKLYQFPGAVFTRAVQISKNSFAIRMFEKLDQIFIKGNPLTNELTKENNISEKTKDAGISTDGTLQYDQETNLLVFTHYYRNEILCLDTNLHLIRKIKTIDINSIPPKKAEAVAEKSVYTNLAPEKLINASTSVSKGKLYNNSQVKADNESNSFAKDNSTIDIYDLKNGMIDGSFYISKYKGEKLLKIKVLDNKLWAIYNNYIVTYRLSF